MREINIVVANPAGNITAFVLSSVEQKDYISIGKALLDDENLSVEQVAFVKEYLPNPRMEMCGLEFCGNAGRAFGFLCASRAGLLGDTYIEISESGCEHSLLVDVNVKNKTAFITMPLPKDIITLHGTGIEEIEGATLVDFGGIMHLVMKDSKAKPSMEFFASIKDFIMKEYNPPALGVMFLHKDKSITPFVYVKDVDSIYEEGSCGSGTTACAIAWSKGKKEGNFEYVVKQPAGELKVLVRIVNGMINGITLGGHVELSEIMRFNLDI